MPLPIPQHQIEQPTGTPQTPTTTWRLTAFDPTAGSAKPITLASLASLFEAGDYAAGTGLSLTGTTFSLANTAVTPATYGSASAVPLVTVDAQGRITGVTTAALSAGNITDGGGKVIMTDAERTKLSGIATGATTAGATGDAYATSHDADATAHTAEQITETSIAKIMTDVERTKLAGIATGAEVNPTAATDLEVTDGLGTTVLGYTPEQLKLAAETWGGGSLIAAESPLGGPNTSFWLGTPQQAAATLITNRLVALHDSYLRAYHIKQAITSVALDVQLPAAVVAGTADVTKRSFIHVGSSRPGLLNSAGTTFASNFDGGLRIGRPDDVRVRLTPVSAASGGIAVCSVIDNRTEPTDPYYCWSLGDFEVTLTTARSFVLTTLAAASAAAVATAGEGVAWSGTLTTAQWKKCVVIPLWGTSGGGVARRLGPPMAWLPDATNIIAHVPSSPSGFSYTVRFEIRCYEGSAWKVHHAYGATGASAADTFDMSLRDTPPLGNFQVTTTGAVSITAGGAGYSNSTITPSGTFTGTKPTFTITQTGGVVTAVTAIATAGDFTVHPATPWSMTGGTTAATLTVGTSAVMALQGSASSVTAWNRAMIVSRMWRGQHMVTSATRALSDCYPIVKPGTAADGTQLGNVHASLSTAHANSHEACYAYVVEDVYTAGTSDRRMLVTRFDDTSTAASPAKINISSAALPSINDAIVIGQSHTTSDPTNAEGYGQGQVGWHLISALELEIVRENAETGTFVGHAQVVRLPRREII
jgi:hypothetical protein